MTHQHAIKTLAAERYLLNEMAELERYDFEDHYFSCADCAEDVRLGELLREGAKAGFVKASADEDRRSIPAAKPRLQWRIVVPWAAAASLAVVTGYQLFFTAPRQRDEFGPRALAPISLRPASRGAEATVALGRTVVTTFAVDVNGVDSITKLTYDLSAADGTLVASGSAPAPVASAPLLLMVPTSTLRAPGQYRLVVRNAEGGAPVGEYRFTATE